MASRVAFGPKDSFCFNYSDPLKATSAGLPLQVKALFERDQASRVTEVSCLALGPDVRYAVVYNSQGQWRFAGEKLPPKLKDWLSNGTDPDVVDKRNGANVRIAIGPDGSWIAFDGIMPEFFLNSPSPLTIAQKDTLEFESENLPDELSQWIIKGRDEDNDRKFKPEYLPQSITLGPNSMYCVTCKKECSFSSTLDESLPTLARILKAVHTASSSPVVYVELSPCYASETKNLSDLSKVWTPYYVLLTANGSCFGEVPERASNQLAEYALDWMRKGVLRQENDARQAAKLVGDLKTAQDEADKVPGLNTALKTAQDEADKVPGLNAALKTAQDEADKVPGLNTALKTAQDEADKVPGLNTALKTAQDEANKVPGLNATLKTARDEADKVPGLNAALKTAQDEANKVPNLNTALKAAQDDADKVPGLNADLKKAQNEAYKVPGMAARIDNLEEKLRKVSPVPTLRLENYTVRDRDRGYDLANSRGICWRHLQDANPGVNWNDLKPGQVLRMPYKT